MTEVWLHADCFYAFEELPGSENFAALEGVDVERSAFFEAADDEMAWRSDRFEGNAESAGDEQING